MEQVSVRKLLSQHPFFERMAPEQLDLISGCAQNKSFNEGEYLCKEATPANEFFLIRHGIVSLEVHCPGKGDLVLETIGPNEILGWSWIVPPYEWLYNAKAKENVRVTSLDGRCLRNKCDEDPRLGYELMKRFSVILANRLKSTRLRLKDLYGGQI